MRYCKILGAALTIALLLGGIGGGSASATTMCKAVQNPCAAANKYPSGTEYTAELVENNEAVLVSVFEEKCTSSKIVAKQTALEGSPLLGEIGTYLFGGCTPCTTETAIHLKYKTELELTEPGNGNMTLRSNGAGNPTFKLTNCPGGVSCVYKAEAVAAQVTGGQPALVKFENASFEKESGPLICGPVGTFNAEYEITEAKEPGMAGVANPRVMVEG